MYNMAVWGIRSNITQMHKYCKVLYTMNKEQRIRDILISNAVSLVAEGGFEIATTKAITYISRDTDVKMNEVYIYRFFGSKENLFAAAFHRLDREFLFVLHSAFAHTDLVADDTEDAFYTAFLEIWDHVINNEAKFRYYIRYYYSAYFVKLSLQEHLRLFDDIIGDFSHVFVADADVRSVMHSVLTILLDFAVRVYNGDLEDNDQNRPHVFRVLRCTLSGYLKEQYKTN